MSRKEAKVTQIICAAIKEFLAKGLDAASMQQISDSAEVSKRTLYKYYSSKEELFYEMIDEVLEQVDKMYKIEFSIENSVHTQMSIILDKKIELTLDPKFIDLSRIIFGELLKGRAPRPEQLQRLNQSEMVFVKWIEQAQQAGKMTTHLSATEIADQFHSILKGKIFWPILFNLEQRENLNLPKIKENVLNFFENSFCLLK